MEVSEKKWQQVCTMYMAIGKGLCRQKYKPNHIELSITPSSIIIKEHTSTQFYALPYQAEVT
jgi:hypothetical protein